MKRLYLGVSCALALILLSGWAGSGNSSSRFFQSFLSGFHRTDAAVADAKEKDVCILDPAAYAQQLADPAVENEKAPVAELAETTYDFGKIVDGEEFVHQFRVRNTGKSVLNIKKVLPG
jgi:hypothetical protein